MAERPSFNELLQAKWDEGKFVCVGLDADVHHKDFPSHLGSARYHAQLAFLRQIITSTHDLVCAYKPNIAFFEDDPGADEALEDAVSFIHDKYPGIPVIGDVKRADIGNTNQGYARMAFERYNFDAVTTNPYFGHDTYPPFLTYQNRGLIALCKTSNPEAALYQDLRVDLRESLAHQVITPQESEDLRRLTNDTPTIPLYWLIAYRHGALARQNPNIGIVVGATHPEAFGPVRRLYGEGMILIPGIGKQGGDLEKTLQFAPNSKGQGIIINSAREIIFASSGEDFAEAARAKALETHNRITELRKAA